MFRQFPEVYYRLGEVPALATPDPTIGGSHRASAHVSYIHEDPNESADRGEEVARQSATSKAHSSLVPPNSAADTARESYFTTTSSESRISRLSDFPAPPIRDTMTPVTTLINSYSDNTAGEEDEDPLNISKPSTPSNRRHQSRRTTFGGEEDITRLQASIS